jgi:hypothetical protein
MNDYYTVPCISTAQLTETDRSMLLSKDRDATEVCCMYDPTDPNNGCFIWIDEEGDPPVTYSAAFGKLWQWAQHQGFTWVRLADWGDVIEGLHLSQTTDKTIMEGRSH